MKTDKNGNVVPKCQVPGCDKYAQNTKSADDPRYRKASWVRDEFFVENGYVCNSCHDKHRADAKGMTVAEMNADTKKRNEEARALGFKDLYAHAVFMEEEEAREAGFHNVEQLRIHKLLLKVQAKGFDTIEDHDKFLQLKRANKAGYETTAEYNKFLNELRAKEAGFTSAKEYNTHLELKRAKEAGFETVRDYNRFMDLKRANEAGYETTAEYNKARDWANCLADGYTNLTDWRNRNHPYLKYRKKYCENIDGRLGFTCQTGIDEMLDVSDGEFQGMLEVDHKDGNSENNSEDNLQTLCSCCHAYKTWISGDGQTKGRKTIRKEKLEAQRLDELEKVA